MDGCKRTLKRNCAGFADGMLTWLKQQAGEKRQAALLGLMDEEGFAAKAAQRKQVNLQALLAAEQEQLLHVIARKR